MVPTNAYHSCSFHTLPPPTHFPPTDATSEISLMSWALQALPGVKMGMR